MHTPVHKKEMSSLLTHIRNSAARRGIEFTLTINDLNNLTFPVTCPILGMPLYFNRGMADDNSYSIDRIDSARGYCSDNIIVISNRANKLKSDSTIEELKKIVEYYEALDGLSE
jgi:hypothetical protein